LIAARDAANYSTPRSFHPTRFYFMRLAFKEWAVVVDALGRGEQILILRKGGLREGAGGFQVEQSEFLLFPTLFHQQRDAVLPKAQIRFDELAPRLSADVLRIEYFARVAAWQRLESLPAAQILRGQHIWREEVIAGRFEWGGAKQIHALALRVFRLPATVQVPMLPAYGGCKSWIELARDISAQGAQPALDDEAFAEKLAEFEKAAVANSPLRA
jgi:hypothetical protein